MAAYSRRILSGFILLALVVVSGGLLFAFFGDAMGLSSEKSTKTALNTETTGTVRSQKTNVGASGLQLPRFVSLKADQVNVRRGPSSEHAISWVFTQKGRPVEIVAEFEHWRRVRDSDGEEGWIYQSLLTGKRTALVSPWQSKEAITMYTEPHEQASKVAVIQGGVLGKISACDGQWCELVTPGAKGWIKQVQLWGVYPDERIK